MISQAAYDEILREGLRLWNEHRFFECHDKLEEAWKEVKHEKKAQPASDPRRDFLQGLILLAVAYHHWRNGNRVGALRKHHEAQKKLQAYGPTFSGVRVGAILDSTEADFQRLERDESARFLPSGVPRLP